MRGNIFCLTGSVFKRLSTNSPLLLPAAFSALSLAHLTGRNAQVQHSITSFCTLLSNMAISADPSRAACPSSTGSCTKRPDLQTACCRGNLGFCFLGLSLFPAERKMLAKPGLTKTKPYHVFSRRQFEHYHHFLLLQS